MVLYMYDVELYALKSDFSDFLNRYLYFTIFMMTINIGFFVC